MPAGLRLLIPRQPAQWVCWIGIICLALSGCANFRDRMDALNQRQGIDPDQENEVNYLGKRELTEYLDHSTARLYPQLEGAPEDIQNMPERPRTIKERLDTRQVWDISLAECIQLALANNKIIRRNDRSTSQGNSSRVLTSPDGSTSIWDPAIQETGVLFGGRGSESALSAFDAQLSSRFNLGKSEIVQNNLFGGGGLAAGNTLVSDTSSMATSLSKQFGTGGSLQLSHSIDYTQNNIPTALFPSSYAGNIRADIRQPLWSGAGVEYTRIAGPVGQNIQGLSGVNQGVLIARLNNDITIADFESNVTDMLFDVEKLYWDLYLAYRRYSSAIKAREAGLKTWQDVWVKFEVGAEGGDGFLEAQARDAYYARIAQEEQSLAQLDTLEGSLRRLLGLQITDGRVLRPKDEPVVAKFTPDWYSDLAMALTRRIELRRQKWNIKSLELQMKAAKSLTNPRLDFVSSYQVNGFGDRLMSDHRADGVTAEGFHNFYDTLLRGNQTGYTYGFEFSMPLGFRAAHAQVRNIELRIARARQVLKAQEHDITFELAQAYQDLVANWSTAQTYFNRRLAAEEQARFVEQQRLQGKKEATLRDLLEAQAHVAEADTAYYQSIIEYTKTIAYVNYRKGALLEMNNVYLAENQWDPAAYNDALRRAWARSYALKNPLEKWMITSPEAFTSETDPNPPGYALPDGVVPPTALPDPGQEPQPLAPDVEVDVPPLPAENPSPTLEGPVTQDSIPKLQPIPRTATLDRVEPSSEELKSEFEVPLEETTP